MWEDRTFTVQTLRLTLVSTDISQFSADLFQFDLSLWHFCRFFPNRNYLDINIMAHFGWFIYIIWLRSYCHFSVITVLLDIKGHLHGVKHLRFLDLKSRILNPNFLNSVFNFCYNVLEEISSIRCLWAEVKQQQPVTKPWFHVFGSC